MHGLSIVGRIRGDENDIAASFSILASEDEDAEPEASLGHGRKLGKTEGTTFIIKCDHFCLQNPQGGATKQIMLCKFEHVVGVSDGQF